MIKAPFDELAAHDNKLYEYLFSIYEELLILRAEHHMLEKAMQALRQEMMARRG